MKNEITITKRHGDWTYGHTDEYDFQVKHFDRPSSFGIEEGRISKLWITRHSDRRVIAAYDRGWDILPGTEEELDATQAIIDRFN